jgi:hypothetical protein
MTQKYNDGRTSHEILGVFSFPAQTETLLCRDYSILTTSQRNIGKRSHIFYNTKSPAVVDRKPIRVLKDHYRHPNSFHSEASYKFLHHSHAEETVPGVVKVMYSSKKVVRPEGFSVFAGSLMKTRMGLHQYDLSFMDIKTPREALMAV